MDNVDQRITADLEKLLLTTAQIYPTLILSPFTIGYYTHKCYNATGAVGPLVIFLVFLLGTICNKFLMGPVVSKTVQQEAAEGDFRYFHMKVRSCSQSIAFYNGGSYELRTGNQSITALIKVQASLFFRQFVVKCFTSFYDYMGAIQSYLVIAVPIFGGHFKGKSGGELTEIVSAYSFQSMYLIYCFSTLIDLSNKISEIAGVTHRVGELVEAFHFIEAHQHFSGAKNENESPAYSRSGSFDVQNDSTRNERRHFPNSLKPLVSIKNLTFGVPTGSSLGKEVQDAEFTTSLVYNLSLKVFAGDRLLITGPNGIGKSSLLRVLASMWTPKSGEITINSDRVLFLPQVPYFSRGSLLDQMFYPQIIRSPTENDKNQAMKVLKELGLDYILDRCNGSITDTQSWNWTSELSQGEAQKLSFARVFLNRPTVLFMDEATSAISSDEELKIFKKLNNFDPPLKSYVSIAHSVTVYKHHNIVLELSSDQTWMFKENATFERCVVVDNDDDDDDHNEVLC